MTTETNLTLGSLVIPVGAGRGITQTLDNIVNGKLRRTVNGVLVDLTVDNSRKFLSKISATDQKTPTFAGIWNGMTMTVGCIVPIRQLVDPAGTTATLMRPYVSGTVVGRDSGGNKIAPTSVVGQLATFPSNVVIAEFVPFLTMLVTTVTCSTDEYTSLQAWDIELEEV